MPGIVASRDANASTSHELLGPSSQQQAEAEPVTKQQISWAAVVDRWLMNQSMCTPCNMCIACLNIALTAVIIIVIASTPYTSPTAANDTA